MNRYAHVGLSCLLVIGAAATVSERAAAAQAKPAAAQASGTTSLGSVRIPRAVKANGQDLPAGTVH